MGRGGTDSLWSSGMTCCCVVSWEKRPQPIWEEVVELRRLNAFGVTGVTWAVLVLGTTLNLNLGVHDVPPSGVVLSKR